MSKKQEQKKQVKLIQDENRIWITDGKEFFLRDKRNEISHLENWVYKLCVTPLGEYYLEKVSDSFSFDYKIYELEEGLINRFLKTYDKTTGNLGILLNGLKGTGKTVTSKLLCNALQQPTIIVPIAGGEVYLNSIPQDVTIFVDEFEKVYKTEYGNDHSMLTVMDGALNSYYRRMFIFTTNKLHVNENLLQRPTRIRYMKTFSDLKITTIKSILDDCLAYKDLYADTLKFISSLEMITVDIVKSVINEVNIHEESPFAFADIFNVKQLSGKYDVFMRFSEEDKETLYKKAAVVSPRESYWIEEDTLVGNHFYIDNNYIGEIKERINDTTIKVQVSLDKESAFWSAGKIQPITGVAKKNATREIIFTIERSFMTHGNFRMGEANSIFHF